MEELSHVLMHLLVGTKGDHPLCSDNLPLSLDWSYSENEEVKNIENGRERKSRYVFPKRLSYEDRQKRISEDDDSVEEDEWQFAKPVSMEVSSVEEDHDIEVVENNGSQSVIYCRHAISEEDPDDDDDDSLNYLFDWSKFTGFS